MTFSAIVEADTLSETIGALTPILDECRIHLEPDGIEVQGVDPANVAMTRVELDANGFESYDAGGGLIGVDLERLAEVAGMAESGDLIQIELDEATNKLEIVVGDSLEFTMALIDPDSIRQEPDIPDLDLPAAYVFEGGELDRAITAADLCSDHIALEARADSELVFSAEGDTDDVEVTLADRDLLSGRLEGDGAESLFSLDYLKDLRKPIGSETEVSMVCGDEMPAKLRYSLADGDVSVLNMLAPRIQSE